MMTKLEVTDDTFVVRILIEALLLDNGVFSDIVSQAGSFIFKSEKTLSSLGMCKETSQMPTVQVSENSQNISSEFSLPEFFCVMRSSANSQRDQTQNSLSASSRLEKFDIYYQK
jgi:hypothetical protein